MRIAVIILNYNSYEDCCKCTSFLKKQTGIDLELIIVDNCSQDSSKIEALCKTDGYTYLASKENKGYNAGNNIGLRYADQKGYKYALIANPDMEFPQTDYVKKLISVMESHDDIVMVGSDIIGPNNSHQNPLNFVSFWSEFLWPIDMIRNKILKRPISSVMDYTTSRYCPMLSGCCFAIRLDFLKRQNFFDENVFLYCEEPILAYQIKKAKKKIYYRSDCTAIHRHIKSTKGNPYKRTMILCDSRNYKNKYYSDYNTAQLALLYISHKIRKFIMKLLVHNLQHSK